MDDEKTDLLIQYAVACAASHENWQCRSLRAIHILKYVYLADLGFSEKYGGRTFTGAPWEFHSFGPWSTLVHARIALALVGASFEARSFETDRGEGVAYGTRDAGLKDRLEAQLPLAASTSLRRAVRSFGTATDDLLHHVYKTRPMLHAAPRERLDFSTSDEGARAGAPVPEGSPSSRKQEKRQAEILRDIRARAAELRKVPRPSGRVVVQPTYSDEVIAALAEASQVTVEEPPTSGTLYFADDVWASPGRTEDELP